MEHHHRECACVNIDFGSYANQIWVHAPEHMPKENGYCLDRCIAEEVVQLWMKKIVTTGCCCGHNKLPGYIGVTPEYRCQMLELGYIETTNPDHFYPKTTFTLQRVRC